MTIRVGDDADLGSVAIGDDHYDLRAAQPAASAAARDSSQLLDMAGTRENQFFDALDMHGAAAELASAAILLPTEGGALRLDKERALRRLYLALRPPAPAPARLPTGGGALGKKTSGPRPQPTARLQGILCVGANSRPAGSALGASSADTKSGHKSGERERERESERERERERKRKKSEKSESSSDKSRKKRKDK